MARHLPGVLLVDRVIYSNAAITVQGQGVTTATSSRPPRLEVLTLASTVLSILAANDFGSVKLFDLPTNNLIYVGAYIDLTVTVAGMATNTAAALAVALGIAQMNSTGFSNAGEKNLIANFNGVGGGASGTLKGAVTNTEKLTFLASGAKSVYLNAADPVTAGTGTATMSGTISFIFMDVGAPS